MLTAGKLPAIGLSRGLPVASESDRNSHQSCEPTIHCDWGNPNVCLDQPITKGKCQPTGGHISFPTDRPDATKLRLFSSLQVPSLLTVKYQFHKLRPFQRSSLVHEALFIYSDFSCAIPSLHTLSLSHENMSGTCWRCTKSSVPAMPNNNVIWHWCQAMAPAICGQVLS